MMQKLLGPSIVVPAVLLVAGIWLVSEGSLYAVAPLGALAGWLFAAVRNQLRKQPKERTMSPNWKFRCKICNKMRPNEKISVISIDRSKEEKMPVGTLTEHINYCNDNPECHVSAIDRAKKPMEGP